MKSGGEREGINCKGKENKTAKGLEGGKKQDTFKEFKRRPEWPEYREQGSWGAAAEAGAADEP